MFIFMAQHSFIHSFMFIESYQLGYCIYDKSFHIIDRHGDFNTHWIPHLLTPWVERSIVGLRRST